MLWLAARDQLDARALDVEEGSFRLKVVLLVVRDVMTQVARLEDRHRVFFSLLALESSRVVTLLILI